MTVSIRSDRYSTDASAPVRKRDNILYDGNGGDLFLGEFALEYCYDGDSAASDGDTLTSANESLDTGEVVLTGANEIAFADGCFDFSSVNTDAGGYLELPASIASDIWGGGSGAQYFMSLFYVHLPSQADWNNFTSFAPFLAFSDAIKGYQAGADLVTIGQHRTDEKLWAFRQTSIGNADTLILQPKVADYGGFAQILFYRNSGGEGLRLKTANGTEIVTGAAGANNSENFSGLTAKFGIGPAFWRPSTQADHLTANNFKLARPYFENLDTSGRDPIALADADYDRVIARGLYGL